MRSARATIAGFELMRMFRKGQFRFWIEAIGGGTEVRFINRLFGLRLTSPNNERPTALMTVFATEPSGGL